MIYHAAELTLRAAHVVTDSFAPSSPLRGGTGAENNCNRLAIQSDSKLLSEFWWPIIFKPITVK
jgi:hypothetical protein